MAWQLGALVTLLSLAAEPLPNSPPPETFTCSCGDSCEATRPWQLLLGYRAWFSWGNADDLVGVSRFNFRNTYSTVHEFNVDAAYERLVGRLDLGFGNLNDGLFRDVNTATDAGGNQFAVDQDGLFYITADVGYRVLQRGDLRCRGCALDLLAGYQYWRESYEPSVGGTGLFLDTYTWESVRLGLRGIAVRDRLLLQGRFMVSPYAHFSSEATDYFDPTFNGLNYRIDADRGWGVFSDWSASYRLWRGLSVELGYQVFYLDSGPGTFNGQDVFGGSRHVRHGLLLGAHWRF